MISAANTSSHVSVLLNEVVEALQPRNGGVYIDGTFGAGGYSRGILESADCLIWGIDRDPVAKIFGDSLAQIFPGKVNVLNGLYGNMVELLRVFGVTSVDGVALDLGMSSMQVDEPKRGFSFIVDGPLDMRMGSCERSAAEVVNECTEKTLAEILYKYGEEKAARKVAKEIVKERSRCPITSTIQLARIVRRVVKKAKDGLDPATRTFQALRIFVNGELDEIERGLSAAERVLAPGGRLAVVSFHSLEDRRVKSFFRNRSDSRPMPSRHLPEPNNVNKPSTFRLLQKKPITSNSVNDEVNST